MHLDPPSVLLQAPRHIFSTLTNTWTDSVPWRASQPTFINIFKNSMPFFCQKSLFVGLAEFSSRLTFPLVTVLAFDPSQGFFFSICNRLTLYANPPHRPNSMHIPRIVKQPLPVTPNICQIIKESKQHKKKTL